MGREKSREGGERRGRTLGQEGWPGFNGRELGASHSGGRAHCHLTPTNFSVRAFFLFFFLPLGFFLFPLHPTSRIGILDLENFDLIRISSRARYPRSPPNFFRIDSVCISWIFERNNRHHLGFHCIHQYMYYTTVG